MLMFGRLLRRFRSRREVTAHGGARAAAPLIECLESRQFLSIAPSASADATTALADASVQMHIHSEGTVLIPGSQPRDLIIDNTHHELLVVEATQLLRYNLSDFQLHDQILLGSDMTGGDITPDGHYLYLAERGSHAIYKVDLEAGTATSIVVSDYLGTPIDIAIGGSVAIISQAAGASGDNMLKLDLTDDRVDDLWLRDIGPLSFAQYAILARSADYGYVALTSTNGDCSFVNNWVDGDHASGGYGVVNSLAVSRDGALHAVAVAGQILVLDSAFHTVKTLSFSSASVAFDPSQDLLYVADAASDLLITYDIHSWTDLVERPIGEALHAINPYGEGVITVGNDGTVYIATASGVRTTSSVGYTSSFGQPVTFDADVATIDADGPKPGGTVTFMDTLTGDTLGQATLVSGLASFTRSDLPAGTHSIFARYSGDPFFNSAESSSVTFEISKARTSLSFAATTSTSARITVNSPGGIPDSGTITVIEDGIPVVTSAVDGGIADVDLPLSLGGHRLNLSYSGSDSFLPSTADVVFFVKNPTTTAITVHPGSTVYGKNLHLEATVLSGAAPVNNGTVTFTDDSGFSDAVNVFNGLAILNTSVLSLGLHTITAHYDGDQLNQFSPSTSAAVQIRVEIVQAFSRVKLTASRGFIPQGRAITFRAAVSSDNAPQPDGLVIFKDGKRSIGSADTVNGVATLSKSLGAGTHSITAVFSGDQYNKASTSNATKISVVAGSTVDLLIVYTPKALDDAGGQSDIAKLISDSVDDANTALWNSKIPLVLNLVYSTQVNYKESGKLETDLNRLTRLHDGFMDEVHGLRNSYGADLVSLFVGNGNLGGVGWELRDLHDKTDASFGFSVILAPQAAAPYYTLAHELGHNFGATHDAQHPEGKGATSFSNGWRFRGKNGVLYHDIMSYDPGKTIPYFSNPRIKFQSVAIGDANTADSARTITMTAPFVAAYRRSRAAHAS